MVEGVNNLSSAAVLMAGGETQTSLPPSAPETTSTVAGDAASATIARADSSVAKTQNQDDAADQKGSGDETPAIDEKKLEESIQELNDKLYTLNRQLQFKMDKDLNRSYISVIDKTTKEVVKEIPPKAIRNLMLQLREYQENCQYRAGDAKDLFVNVEV